jgi:hypothetical protein
VQFGPVPSGSADGNVMVRNNRDGDGLVRCRDRHDRSLQAVLRNRKVRVLETGDEPVHRVRHGNKHHSRSSLLTVETECEYTECKETDIHGGRSITRSSGSAQLEQLRGWRDRRDILPSFCWP